LSGIVETRDFFYVLWKDTDSLRQVLDYLLAKRVPDAKRSLNQFCSSREMQETFRITESRNQLKKLVLDRVSEYVDRIPPSVMEEIEEGLKPLYLLKDLATYDFDDFFVQFQSSEDEAARPGRYTFTVPRATGSSTASKISILPSTVSVGSGERRRSIQRYSTTISRYATGRSIRPTR
jgi:hypothetical protein